MGRSYCFCHRLWCKFWHPTGRWWNGYTENRILYPKRSWVRTCSLWSRSSRYIIPIVINRARDSCWEGRSRSMGLIKVHSQVSYWPTHFTSHHISGYSGATNSFSSSRRLDRFQRVWLDMRDIKLKMFTRLAMEAWLGNRIWSSWKGLLSSNRSDRAESVRFTPKQAPKLEDASVKGLSLLLLFTQAYRASDTCGCLAKRIL